MAHLRDRHHALCPIRIAERDLSGGTRRSDSDLPTAGAGLNQIVAFRLHLFQGLEAAVIEGECYSFALDSHAVLLADYKPDSVWMLASWQDLYWVVISKLGALTALRFFAAMHVVLFHTAQAYMTAAPFWTQNIIACGYIGVSFFFILSGFILAYNYLPKGSQQMRGTARDFWWARFARVYPLYAAGLLLALPFFAKSLYDSVQGEGSLAMYIGTLISAPLLLQSWSPYTACTWNCPGWSLSNEAFFYAMFPLLALGIVRLGRRGLWAVGVAALAITLALPLLYIGVQADGLGAGATASTPGFWIDTLGSNPLSHISEFVFGVVVGRLFATRTGSVRPIHTVLTLGSLVVAVVAMGFSSIIPYPLMQHGALDLVFGVMIYNLAVVSPKLDHHVTRWGLIWGGEVSYAIYLLHLPLWGWSTVLVGVLAPGLTASIWFWLGYVALTISVSYAAYRWIEEPARKYIRRRQTRPQQTTAPL